MAEQDVGPIDYLALEFPQAKITGEGMAALLDLVDRGIIRILDLRFAVRGEDGSITAVALADLDHDGQLDLAVFEGAQSDLLDNDDLSESTGVIVALLMARTRERSGKYCSDTAARVLIRARSHHSA